MIIKRSLFAVGVFFSIQVHAFTCFLTLVKDNCWMNYDVTFSVTRGTSGTPVTTVIVPQGTAWQRQKIDCEPNDMFGMTAAFSPVFWKNDEGKVYSALHDWQLPSVVNKGEAAWNVTICYSRDFTEVPMPPDATGHCVCDFDSIPAIKPQ